MNEFESLDDMLTYVSDNADTILKNVDYDSDDPEGMKKALELKAMQELLDEMVAEGFLKIVGTAATPPAAKITSLMKSPSSSSIFAASAIVDMS